MSRLPKITLITPSFNQGNFIDQTIRSILEQDYPDLEYIVVDGGSTDQTLEILRQYGDRITWSSQKDNGQSQAINKGLALASGEIIGFLNSDDYLAPGALLKIGSFFARHNEVDWLTGKCRIVDEQGSEIRKMVTIYKNLFLHILNYGILLVLNPISQPATFWRKKVSDEMGNFDESLHFSMDYEYWLRIGRRYKLHFYNDYLAYYRLHSTSKAFRFTDKQFEAQLDIASHYTTSKVLLGLQALHNRLNMFFYKLLS